MKGGRKEGRKEGRTEGREGTTLFDNFLHIGTLTSDDPSAHLYGGRREERGEVMAAEEGRETEERKDKRGRERKGRSSEDEEGREKGRKRRRMEEEGRGRKRERPRERVSE